MRMKTKLSTLAALLLCSAPGVTIATTNGIVCTGTIKILGVHSTDRVMLRLSDMSAIVHICNTGQTLGTSHPVSAEQCKVAYSTLLTAYTLGKAVKVVFDNVPNGTSCSTFSNWEVATARWVYLDDLTP